MKGCCTFVVRVMYNYHYSYSTILDSLISQSINITYDRVKDLSLVSLVYTLYGQSERLPV